MLHVWWASGEELSAVSGAEVLEVRSLKQRLQKLCGASRFRQRLLHHGLQLEDDAILKPPMDVQLVLLPFVHTQAEDRALLDAARDGDLLMTEEMLRRPVNPSVVIDNIDECHTPLGMACQAGHQEVVGMLLQASADVDGEFGVYGQESTPLGTAIENGALLIAHTLLACGANPGQPHFWLGTGSFEFPLVIASFRGDVTLVRQLLHAGAHPHDAALSAANGADVVSLLQERRRQAASPNFESSGLLLAASAEVTSARQADTPHAPTAENTAVSGGPSAVGQVPEEAAEAEMFEWRQSGVASPPANRSLPASAEQSRSDFDADLPNPAA
eukprot:s1949_g17.t1